MLCYAMRTQGDTACRKMSQLLPAALALVAHAGGVCTVCSQPVGTGAAVLTLRTTNDAAHDRRCDADVNKKPEQNMQHTTSWTIERQAHAREGSPRPHERTGKTREKQAGRHEHDANEGGPPRSVMQILGQPANAASIGCWYARRWRWPSPHERTVAEYRTYTYSENASQHEHERYAAHAACGYVDRARGQCTRTPLIETMHTFAHAGSSRTETRNSTATRATSVPRVPASANKSPTAEPQSPSALPTTVSGIQAIILTKQGWGAAGRGLYEYVRLCAYLTYHTRTAAQKRRWAMVSRREKKNSVWPVGENGVNARLDVMAPQTSGDGAPGVEQRGTAPERCREDGGVEEASLGGSRWTARQMSAWPHMWRTSCRKRTRA